MEYATQATPHPHVVSSRMKLRTMKSRLTQWTRSCIKKCQCKQMAYKTYVSCKNAVAVLFLTL